MHKSLIFKLVWAWPRDFLELKAVFPALELIEAS